MHSRLTPLSLPAMWQSRYLNQALPWWPYSRPLSVSPLMLLPPFCHCCPKALRRRTGSHIFCCHLLPSAIRCMHAPVLSVERYRRPQKAHWRTLTSHFYLPSKDRGLICPRYCCSTHCQCHKRWRFRPDCPVMYRKYLSQIRWRRLLTQKS